MVLYVQRVDSCSTSPIDCRNVLISNSMDEDVDVNHDIGLINFQLAGGTFNLRPHHVNNVNVILSDFPVTLDP
jgi:hypothetical protein